MKKLPQDSNAKVMLIWCLTQVKDFFLKFIINWCFCWGAQNYWMCYIQYCFFPSGGVGVHDVLMRLRLFEKIIKDVSLVCISFSVKYPQIFWESSMSLFNMSRTLSNMYTYPFNPQYVIKHKQKLMIRNRKIKGQEYNMSEFALRI